MLGFSNFRCKDGESMAGTDNSENPCYYPQELSTMPPVGMGCGMGGGMMGSGAMMGMPGMGQGMMGTPFKTAVCVDKNNKVTASAMYTIGKMGDREFAIVQGSSRFITKGSKIVGIEREEYMGKTTVEFNERNTKVTQTLAGKQTKQCTYEKEAYPIYSNSEIVPAVR